MSSSKTEYVDYSAISKLLTSKWVIANVETAKNITPGTLKKVTLSDALKFGGHNPMLLIDLEFSGLPVISVVDSGFDITLDGNEYKALGDVLSINGVELNRSLETKGVKIELSGEVSEYIRAANLKQYIGGLITIRVALADDGNNIISVFTIQRCLMDTVNVIKSTKSVKLSIGTASVFKAIENVYGSLPVDDMHQIESPNDTIFEYVPSMREQS